MLLKPIYQKVYERAKPFLRTRKNLIHTKISLQYALKLLGHGKGDEEVVIPAILLHDVGWKTIPENLHLTAFGPNPSNPKLARIHEVEGAKIAKPILEECIILQKKLRRSVELSVDTIQEKKPSLPAIELLRMQINFLDTLKRGWPSMKIGSVFEEKFISIS